jgi:hypothetical protein
MLLRIACYFPVVSDQIWRKKKETLGADLHLLLHLISGVDVQQTCLRVRVEDERVLTEGEDARPASSIIHYQNALLGAFDESRTYLFHR